MFEIQKFTNHINRITMKNKIEKRPDNIDTSVFGSEESMRVSPKCEIPQNPMPQEIAYQIVHDETLIESRNFGFISPCLQSVFLRLETVNSLKVVSFSLSRSLVVIPMQPTTTNANKAVFKNIFLII